MGKQIQAKEGGVFVGNTEERKEERIRPLEVLEE